MNIIVTGGAGFIGSNFVFHMARKASRLFMSTKRPYSQPQMRFNSPKPPLLRTYHIRKACISQVLHQKRKSV